MRRIAPALSAAAAMTCLMLIGGSAPTTLPQSAASGAAAWKIADDAVAPAADLAAAIDSAKALSELNIQNADTPGFKSLRCVAPDAHPVVLIQLDQGSIQDTGRQLDVAISGNGFLRVKIDPPIGDGVAYTRCGNLYRDQQGDLVVANRNDGYRLDPPINIPQNTTGVSIASDGRVQVQVTGQIARQVIGRIGLYYFVDPTRLKWLRSNLYLQSDQSGPPIELSAKDQPLGELEQGYLEKSNVDLARECKRVEFLEAWRAAVLK